MGGLANKTMDLDSNKPKSTIPIDADTELDTAQVVDEDYEGLHVERMIRERSHAKIPFHSPMEYELQLPDIDEFKFYHPKQELLSDPLQDFIENDRLEHIDTIYSPRQDIILVEDNKEPHLSKALLQQFDSEFDKKIDPLDGSSIFI